MPIDTYQITIEDRVEATSYKDALAKVMRRISSGSADETMAQVERMSTGQTKHFEIQTGECLDEDE